MWKLLPSLPTRPSKLVRARRDCVPDVLPFASSPSVLATWTLEAPRRLARPSRCLLAAFSLPSRYLLACSPIAPCLTVCIPNRLCWMSAEPCGKRVRDRTAYYDAVELVAANKLVKSLIKRHRWRKIVQQAKARSEFDKRIRHGADHLLARDSSAPPACRKAAESKPGRKDNSAKLLPDQKQRIQNYRQKRRSPSPNTGHHHVNATRSTTFIEHPGRVRDVCSPLPQLAECGGPQQRMVRRAATNPTTRSPRPTHSDTSSEISALNLSNGYSAIAGDAEETLRMSA